MIGIKVKNYRKKNGLTLEELGKKAGITASYLSQVERGLAEPSIASLRKVGKALNVPIYKFLVEGEEQDKFIIRKNERTKTQRIEGKGVTEFLTPLAKENNNLAMVCLSGMLPPFSATGTIDESIHNAEEMILIVKGIMEITVEDEVNILNEGDSIYIKANLKHIIKNIGENDLEIISCISPGIY